MSNLILSFDYNILFITRTRKIFFPDFKEILKRILKKSFPFYYMQSDVYDILTPVTKLYNDNNNNNNNTYSIPFLIVLIVEMFPGN